MYVVNSVEEAVEPAEEIAEPTETAEAAAEEEEPAEEVQLDPSFEFRIEGPNLCTTYLDRHQRAESQDYNSTYE